MRVLDVELRLDVRYREKTFVGTVRIDFEEAADPLELDAEGLELRGSTLDGAPISPAADVPHHRLVVTGVPPGRHRLEIDYSGSAATDSLVGLYVAPAAATYVLTTMLFPTGSRRLWPAFEHPAVKTVYRVTVTTESDLRVIFNTEAAAERELDGRKEWTFAPTPPMSAYLLYLGIGPFDVLTVEGGRCRTSVAASPGRSSAGRYAAERAKELVVAYEEYYGQPYPLAKLDLIALENFWAGAMENWGAIAFRDDALLVDTAVSVGRRRLILVTLAHEIAHQWFGNLVTNRWWDDFWLNESFATFVAYRTVQARYPSDDALSEMLLEWVGPAFDMDALRATHPVHVPVETPEQLGENADPVTYGKGAAVLRMMESYLGEETFRRGVSEYLRRYRYGNASAEDLWNTLGEVSDRPVPRILADWITRPGYPIVHARWSDGTLVLRQERYLQDGAHLPGIWSIPLRIRTPTGERSLVFDRPEVSLPVDSPRGLRIDPGRPAFVRFHLEGELFDRLLEELSALDPFDQWGAVTDLGALIFSRDAPPTRLLDLLERAAEVTHDLPLRAIARLVDDFRSVADGIPSYERATRGFLARQVERIGVEPREGEPDSLRALRETLVLVRVRADPGFARELGGRFGEYDRVPGTLRTPVVIAYASSAGAAAFEPLLARMRASDVPGERVRMILGLGSQGDPGGLRRALDLVGTPEITPANFFLLLRAATRAPSTGRGVFDWFRANAARLSTMWAGTPLMSGFLQAGIVGMGLDREEEVRAFFAAHTPADAVAGAGRGLESLATTMRLRTALTRPR